MAEKRIMKERVELILALNELKREYIEQGLSFKSEQDQKNQKKGKVNKNPSKDPKNPQNVKIIMKHNLEVASDNRENEQTQRAAERENEGLAGAGPFHGRGASSGRLQDVGADGYLIRA